MTAATNIGKAVTIGAGTLLRSCKIEDMAVIGERCIVLEGSIISEHVVLLPGTVVPPAKLIPKGQVWAGNPAQFVRNLTHDEVRAHALVTELVTAACHCKGAPRCHAAALCKALEVHAHRPAHMRARYMLDRACVQELEVPQLTNSHEKWRDLYTVEELPYGNGWKRAEEVDPTEARLFPDDQQPPEWVPQNVKDSKKQLN